MARNPHLAYGIVGLGVLAVGVIAITVAGVDEPAAYAAPLVRRAAPETLATVLRALHGGERVVLSPGDYGDVRLPQKTFVPAVQIDASRARFSSVSLRGAGGVSIVGGVVDGPRKQTATVVVDSAHDIQLRGMRTSGSVVGMSVSRSHNVVLTDNVFDAMASDGINVSASQNVRIERNVCRDFTPTPAVFDARGKLLKGGNHPDCIQGWSVPGKPPLADLTIIGNTGRGSMQGIFFGNVGQGGIDRIVVRDNTFDITAFNGIVVMDARNVQITHNVVRTIPGARMLNYPFKPITAWIRVFRGRDVLVCGNTVDKPRFSDDQGPCPKGGS